LIREPGEELQLDWLELRETPWGAKAHVLVGALPNSGRISGIFSDQISFAHLAGALDQLLRRFGGTAKSWRTDRIATFVYPGTNRLRPEAAELAEHYGVQVAICPAERQAMVNSEGNRYSTGPELVGQTVRKGGYSLALEGEVLAQFSVGTAPRKRKANRPPDERAKVETRRLREASVADQVTVELSAYAKVAGVAR